MLSRAQNQEVEIEFGKSKQLVIGLSSKARCSVFNAGCNEQVFSLKPEKNLAQIRLSFSHKIQKPRNSNTIQLQKNYFTEPKAKLL